MKNKKGFTLIELLVVIVLMISILIISIISLISISNRKKEEALESIINQIEVASENYFENNRYLYEDLTDDLTGTISVGKLVEEDYINKITNPVTNKNISYCAMVNVKRKKGKFTFNFDRSTIDSQKGNCNLVNSLEVKEYGGPDANLIYYYNNKKQDPPNWFNSTHLDPKIVIEAYEKDNGKIKDISINNESYDILNNSATYKIEDETKNKDLKIMITNIHGKSCVLETSYRRDISLPTGNIIIKSTENGWNSKNVTVDVSANDELSGLNEVLFNNKNLLENKNKSAQSWTKNDYEYTLNIKKYDGQKVTQHLSINDEAGNKNEILSSYTLYKSCLNENIKYSSWKDKTSCTKTCGGGTKKQERNKTDKNTLESCGNEEQTISCNTKACTTTTTTTTTKKTTTTTKKTTKALCDDITIKIPNWIGTKEITVTAESSSKITKISSVYYEQKPKDEYTTNHEENSDNKIAQCVPGVYNCNSSYTYLSVCATNKCGRKVCYYKAAGSNKKTRHYDNKKKK